MNRNVALESRKKEILEKWFQAVADTYPPETSSFLRSKGDRFANPVGFAVSSSLTGLLECCLEEAGPERIGEHLDELVRIRAVQNFPPSKAVGCLSALKPVVREVLGEGADEELHRLDEWVDRLVLLAFDNYMACREKLFEIKVKELKEMVAIQTGNAWRRAAPGGENTPNQERNAEGQS